MSSEHLTTLVQSLLPEPVSISLSGVGEIIVGGEPGEVVVQIRDDEIGVAVFPIRWNGPHTPEIAPKQTGSVHWPELTDTALVEQLKPLIQQARKRRGESFAVAGVVKN